MAETGLLGLYDKFHAAIGVLMAALVLFPYIGPPAVQDALFVGYKINKVLGVVDDANMCFQADDWDIGGIIAELSNGEKMECALLSENRVDVHDVIGIEVQNKRSLNLLFYIPHMLLGLMVASAAVDMWLLIGGRKSTSLVLGVSVMLILGTMQFAFRAGLPQTAIRKATKFLPWGRSMLATMMTIMLAYVLLFWIFSQFIYGFELARRGGDKYKAIETAVRADLARGQVALGFQPEQNRR